MRFNPYGPVEPTRQGGLRLQKIATGGKLIHACGYRGAEDYDAWKSEFDEICLPPSP
jgi:hypothetical protein